MTYVPKYLWVLMLSWVCFVFVIGVQIGRRQQEPPQVVPVQEIKVEEGKPPEKQGKLEQCPICGVTGRRVELEIVPEK